ncbi:MAG: hypothetical protein IKR81_01485 [Victivallales bacterium]|nr:hypothetical protein [Victivallales bacterium]
MKQTIIHISPSSHELAKSAARAKGIPMRDWLGMAIRLLAGQENPALFDAYNRILAATDDYRAAVARIGNDEGNQQ